MATYYDYRIGVGANVALVSLTNVETLLGGFPATSQPVARYPVREIALSGREFGTGRVDHEWQFQDALPLTAVLVLENTLFSAGTLVSAPVTIYTRLHTRGIYQRYNAYAVLAREGEDYEVIDTWAYAFTLRFRGLIALA